MTIRRVLYQDEFNAPVTPAATATPVTAGVRDQDPPASRARAFAVAVVAGAQFIASTPFPPFVPPKAQPVESFARVKPRVLPDLTAWLSSAAPANTPTTDGLRGFDPLRWRPRPALDALTQAQAQTFVTLAPPQSVDPVPRGRRASWDQLGLVVQTTPATVTPTTAGLQDFDLRFIRPMRPALQQVTSFAPVGVSVAATPVTAGLQDLLPVLFGKRFPASLQQDHALAPLGYVANTPQTAGLAGFDPLYRVRRPDGSWVTFTAAPAGTIAGPVPVFDGAARAQRRLEPGWVTATVVTAALATLPLPDFALARVRRGTLQDDGRWAPLVVAPPAVTPSAFSFGRADLPPYRYGMNVAKQMFMWATLRPGITSPPAIIAQPTLIGRDKTPTLIGRDEPTDLDGKVG